MGIWILVHLAATWFMAGLIWLVQIVHYPLFSDYDRRLFSGIMHRHQTRISLVVGPVMMVELVSGGWLLWISHGTAAAVWLQAGFAILIAIWISTAVIQMPRHRQLLAGPENRLIHKLVAENRWRTAGWTMRGILVSLALNTLLPTA